MLGNGLTPTVAPRLRRLHPMIGLRPMFPTPFFKLRLFIRKNRQLSEGKIQPSDARKWPQILFQFKTFRGWLLHPNYGSAPSALASDNRP